MKEPFEREVAVFGTARRLAGAERAAYLDEACAGDTALRQRVEELLEAAEEAEGFLQEPAPGARRPEGAPAAPTLVLNDMAPGEKAGDRIGRYKLLQQIGEGGCGVVYMAEQEEPVRRRVALKVIKLGMDTKSVIARFEAERQALALMDHPNIARVLDAGATETGRPYFVMELVRGIKITDYCDEHNLSMRERLELFMQVCHAVQHAHQKGIIHRDLKPSNILVARPDPDSSGVPKVIDFGIAKATQGRLTDQTLFTAFEQFIGTPAYMSPEQAELTMQDVDTRTDIYSLGVLLYELLTGRTPFDTRELLASGLDVMRRTIREQEPERPSRKLSTMLEGELTTTAKHRHTEAVKLIHSLRGDLDWIVMKSLEKDRSRRYETANGLAVDVKRYLENEPVVARPPSRIYRMRKLVRRNKVAFTAASVIAIVLLLSVVGSTTQAVRITRAEHEKSRLLEKALQAEANEAQLRQEADFARTVEMRLRERAEEAEGRTAWQYMTVERIVPPDPVKRKEDLAERIEEFNRDGWMVLSFSVPVSAHDGVLRRTWRLKKAADQSQSTELWVPALIGVLNLPGRSAAILQTHSVGSTDRLIVKEGQKVGRFEVLHVNGPECVVDLGLAEFHPNQTVWLRLSLDEPRVVLTLEDADLEPVLRLYQEFTGRTLLRWPDLPAVKFTLIAPVASSAEVAAVLGKALATNQIVTIPDGNKFAMVGPESAAARVTPHSGELNQPSTVASLQGALRTSDLTSAEELSPGIIDFRQAYPPEVGKFYAFLLGRRLDTSILNAGRLGSITFKNQAPLSKAEACYAFETLFGWQGLKLMPLPDNMARVVNMSQAEHQK